jgi:hypothetical protein
MFCDDAGEEHLCAAVIVAQAGCRERQRYRWITRSQTPGTVEPTQRLDPITPGSCRLAALERF